MSKIRMFQLRSSRELSPLSLERVQVKISVHTILSRKKLWEIKGKKFGVTGHRTMDRPRRWRISMQLLSFHRMRVLASSISFIFRLATATSTFFFAPKFLSYGNPNLISKQFFKKMAINRNNSRENQGEKKRLKRWIGSISRKSNPRLRKFVGRFWNRKC